MTRHSWIFALALVAGCGSSGGSDGGTGGASSSNGGDDGSNGGSASNKGGKNAGGATNGAAKGGGSQGGASARGGNTSASGGKNSCTASGSSEKSCSDNKDDDCDGYVDCLDTECDGQACGDGLTCSGGACRKPCADGDSSCVPELPIIPNVRVTMHGDTAIVDFEPIAKALDYRIYPEPAAADWLIGDKGEVGVKNGIYRCAGDRVVQPREKDTSSGMDCALSGCPDSHHSYSRTDAEKVLGYVYLTPGADRLPVYRVANPNGGGGFHDSEWNVPIYSEANSAEYVTSTDARDALLAKGWRDDGIVFYTDKNATKNVYRVHYAHGADWQGDNVVFFFADGPEHEARAKEPAADHEDMGARFKILDKQSGDAVPLYRVTYPRSFDVLAAGDARFDQVLHQGGRPLWSVTWPGVKEKTRFIVEALDAGCPFPGGYIAAQHHDADLDSNTKQPFNLKSITLDEARLSSGEVFINGQHDQSNRPKPIARAYVDITPEPKAKMDFLETFDEGGTWGPFKKWWDNNAFIYRNADWAIDTNGCTENFTFGPLLGQFVLGFADTGAFCNISMTPRKVPTKLSADRFLHLRMSTDVPSTGRRYPQIMITTVPLKADPPDDAANVDDIPVHTRLGSFPYQLAGPDMMVGTADDLPKDGGETIVVQPFSGDQETQIEFCDQRGWAVNQQCERANIYGFHAGDYHDTDWTKPWNPNPVQGDLAGFDRPVQWDVYSSTSRVYVFMDGKPAGCAVLPKEMPAGAVTIAYRAVIYHCGIDESVTPENGGHQYERQYSLCHSDRHMDDFGVELSADEPAWDESVLPCGTNWYGGT